MEKLWGWLKDKPLYWLRYRWGFGRHWRVGLPDYRPDMTDLVVAESVRLGQESILLHRERIEEMAKLEFLRPE